MTGVTSIQFTPDQTRTLAGVSRGMMENQGNPAFQSYAGKPEVWKNGRACRGADAFVRLVFGRPHSIVKTLDRTDGEPAKESRAEVRRLERDGWQARIFITGRRESGAMAGHADLYRAGLYSCRITTANDHRDEMPATNDLEARANAWIDDWNSREHSGDTGFVDL